MKHTRQYPLRTGGVLVACCVALAALSFVYTPADPYAMDAAVRLTPPSLLHPFGTDNFGRDLLSRTMVALRYSLVFSTLTLAVSLTIGVGIGLLAASSHRFVDHALMRAVDAVNAVPAPLLALVLTGTVARGNTALVLSLAAVFTPPFVRVARNEALKIRELDYMQRARALGTGRVRLLYRHLLPNLRSPLVSTAAIVATNAILVESTLSYLGLGIQPPVPSLGRMLFDAQNYLFNAPWTAVLPGLMLVVLIAGLHTLGEAVTGDAA